MDELQNWGSRCPLGVTGMGIAALGVIAAVATVGFLRGN